MRIRGIATFRNFARNLSPLVMWQPFQHPLSSSRRGQLGLGRQHRLLGGWLSLYWTNQRQLHWQHHAGTTYTLTGLEHGKKVPLRPTTAYK
jgi:hypothetical protein